MSFPSRFLRLVWPALMIFAATTSSAALVNPVDADFGVVHFAGGQGWNDATSAQDGGVVAIAHVPLGAQSCFSTWAVVRYRANGDLATGFGHGGVIRPEDLGLPRCQGTPLTLLLDGQGRLLLGYAVSVSSVAVLRINADGTWDSSFGKDGMAALVSANSATLRLAVDDAGRILVAGTGAAMGRGPVLFVARLRDDGLLDTSFGGGSGYGIVDLPGINAHATGLAIQNDGKIVVASTQTRTPVGIESDIVVARLTQDGTIDTSFGSGGVATRPFSGSTFLTGLAVQGDSTVLSVEYWRSNAEHVWGLIRLDRDGALDQSFGLGGFAEPGDITDIRGFVQDAQGNLLVVGRLDLWDADVQRVAARRLTRNGAVDRKFGASGLAILFDFREQTLPALAGSGALFVVGDDAAGAAITRLRPDADAHPEIAFDRAIEYFNAALGHYFVTANAQEAHLLDIGQMPGWVRTGKTMPVILPGYGNPTMSPVCRFYGRPEAGLDSHFYSAAPAECQAVIDRFSVAWIFESANVFSVYLPDPVTGACPSGGIPVHRFFNGRSDVNHRYVTAGYDARQMAFQGWIAEGYGPGPLPVAMCAPAS